jgi:capsular polysaccharide biosynthesis protein
MTSHSSMMGDLLQLAAKEAKRRLLTLATLFSLGALTALAVVLMTPKTWEATAVIIAEGNNIIKPLMEGRAVPTTIADQTANVTQVVMSRRIIRELAQYAGLMRAKMSPQEEERLLQQFRARIRIEPQRELIRVSFRDSDPRRTYMVANKVAETFVREGVQTKERESREAFEFINKQVTEYSQKLGQVHEQLLAYYRGQDMPKQAGGVKPAGAGGSDGAATPDDGAPAPAPSGSKPKLSAAELAALRLEMATLEAQVERRPAGAAPGRDESRQLEDQARARVNAAQTELDRLLATYTDQHPDVKRAERTLANAKEDLKRAEQGRTDRDTARAAATALDDEVTRAARGRLEEVRRQISTATGQPIKRRSATPRPVAAALAQEALVPEMRGVGQDTKLSELSRRYEATRDVYQDLLKRRENARVSMELDLAQQGFTLRIQEAAELPMTASGLRMMHQTAIGFVLALLAPIGFLFAIVRFDPRVRTVGQIEKLANVPLLVAIPYASPGGEPRERGRRRLAIAMIVGVLIVYILVFIIRAKAAA